MSSDFEPSFRDAAAYQAVGRTLWAALMVAAILAAAAAAATWWLYQSNQAVGRQAAAQAAAQAEISACRQALAAVDAGWRIGLATGDETAFAAGREALVVLEQKTRLLGDFAFPGDEVDTLKGVVPQFATSLDALADLGRRQKQSAADALLPAVVSISADLDDIRSASAGAGREAVVAEIDAFLPTWRQIASGTGSPALFTASRETHPLAVDWAALQAQFQAVADQMRSQTYKDRAAGMVARLAELATAAATFTENHQQVATLRQQSFAEHAGAIQNSLDALAAAVKPSAATASLTLPGIAVGLILAAWLVMFVAAHRFRRELNNALHHIAEAGARVVGGERDLIWPQTERGDQLGRLALVCGDLDRVLIGQERRLREEHEMAISALQDQSESQADNEMQLARELSRYQAVLAEKEAMVGFLQASAQKLRQAGSQFAFLSERIPAVVAETHGAAEESRGGTAEVVEHAHRLNDMLAIVAERMQSATEVADESAHNADSIEGLIADLSDSALGIDSVIELIEKIVGATRLLSLNASIEAARTGDAGRGFSVIAAEIKSLSDKTAEATEEIRDKINRIKDATRTVTDAVGGITSVIHDLEGIIGEIGTTVAAQRDSVAAVADASQVADSGMQRATEAVGELHALAEQLQTGIGAVEAVAEDVGRQVTLLEISETEQVAATAGTPV